MPATIEIFKNYLTDTFIETGSYIGDGIAKALNVGFKIVHSMEINYEYYNKCHVRFINNDNVNLYNGDSIKFLKDILDKIETKCTFWLDSHNFDETNMCSRIVEELMIIAMHKRHDHIILIDDNRLIETNFGLNREQIKRLLKIINPKYKIDTVDGYDKGVLENDIIVARL